MGFPFELFCPFYALTGLYCPLCGLTRAFIALSRLDLVAALGYNVLVVAALPVLAYLAAQNILARRGLAQLPSPKWPAWTGKALLGVVVGFWVARNLPVYPFTVLAP